MNERDKGASIRAWLEKAFAPAISEMEDMTEKLRKESGAVPLPKPPRLFGEPHWLVCKAKGFAVFFGALADLAPAGSTLQIEGNPYPDVEEGLRPWLKEPSKKTDRFWRTLAKYNVPVTHENMVTLSRLATDHAEPEVADHFLLLHGDEQILHWYDAPSDPIYVSCLLDETKVTRFTESIGATMKKEAGSTGA